VVSEFGQFVDRIRKSVSSHLHHLLVVERVLVGELRIVWDMFIMAKGELFHTFIHMANLSLASSCLAALHQLWAEAMF